MSEPDPVTREELEAFDDSSFKVTPWIRFEFWVLTMRRRLLRLIWPSRRGDRLHAHTCPDCGMTWRHTSEARGCVVSHTCPKCGSGPHWFKSKTPPAPWD